MLQQIARIFAFSWLTRLAHQIGDPFRVRKLTVRRLFLLCKSHMCPAFFHQSRDCCLSFIRSLCKQLAVQVARYHKLILERLDSWLKSKTRAAHGRDSYTANIMVRSRYESMHR